MGVSNELLIKATELEKGVYKSWLDRKTAEYRRRPAENRRRTARNTMETERQQNIDANQKEAGGDQKKNRNITEKQEDY